MRGNTQQDPGKQQSAYTLTAGGSEPELQVNNVDHTGQGFCSVEEDSF